MFGFKLSKLSSIKYLQAYVYRVGNVWSEDNGDNAVNGENK